MQEVRTKILQRLQSDSTLYPGLVPGGLYDRPLKAGKEAGATPGAFWIRPGDTARIPRLRESIVILGPNEVDPPDGLQQTEDLVVRNGFLRIFFYVPATATGKAALDQIDARVRQLLHGWQTTLSHGYALTVTALEMTEPLDSDEFPGNLVCQRRVVGEYLRAAA